MAGILKSGNGDTLMSSLTGGLGIDCTAESFESGVETIDEGTFCGIDGGVLCGVDTGVLTKVDFGIEAGVDKACEVMGLSVFGAMPAPALCRLASVSSNSLCVKPLREAVFPESSNIVKGTPANLFDLSRSSERKSLFACTSFSSNSNPFDVRYSFS